MSARLIIDKGPLSGFVLVFEQGTSWSIGKDAASSDIQLEDPKLANTQVVITKEDDHYFITNLDTSCPVTVNGKEITEATPINDADVITFGSNQYSFFTHEFDPDDVVYDFDFSSENTTNVSPEPADTKKKTKKKSQPAKDEAKQPSSEQQDSSDTSPTDKELAEAFLASAKSEKETSGQKLDMDTLPKTGSKKKTSSLPDVKNTETQHATMEENGALPNQNQPPLPDSDPATQDQSTKGDRPKEGEPVKETPTSAEQSEEKEGISQGEEVSPQETKPEDVQDVEQSHNDQEAPKEKTDTEEETEEQSEEEEEQEGKKTEKAEVLSPFNVQDLFRFDQGIFPAEIDEIAQKNVSVDLSQPSRFLLKVLAGANIGAEFHLDTGKSYILGSDPASADIVFNDLSVSHRHAKIIVSNDGSIMLEDLGSKNGVIIEGKKIENSSTLSANQVIALGTTLFLLIDHLAPADTIIASFAPEDYGLFGRPQDAEEIAQQAAQEEEEKRKRATLPTGSFILTLFIGGLAILFGIGTASLFHTKEVIPIENIDYQEDIERVVNAFPTVRYTFNKNNGQLFLIGHVKNSIDKSELLYKMDALSFIKSIDDNVIDDEAVWQEINILLSKKPEFKGVSMHSPEPGEFVITGYLKTEEQAVCLADYLNVHFNYLSLLENKVIIESQMLKAIAGQLLQAGFANIQVAFVNGEVVLTGYVNHEDGDKFRSVVQEISTLPGVRLVKNFVVLLPVEEGIIDLNLRYPSRYRVTGYSKYGDVSINVVVNGRILTRGDVIDGMTVISIQPHCIFLEKEGLKYKIEYNK
ncbi:type III secretion system inner membrane ring subunit SctD [Chlamydia buteonis]|uniref:Type III secretion system inner membrane ring subunit SctD n=1 Tax=Chlamydia buteonis TaxID=2494525 RepID=A0ABX8LBT7_9CHLA|nr:type III secretion system inner membrane ring subunit SctD [Chlamydia buteonis]QXE26623.1 type III secretion system inner membrane ring subunit SctD [Chlamydia buteonis]QXE27581.1 type III secretion system inner membrane ring subunit SctD [Chlamydia buteonis]